MANGAFDLDEILAIVFPQYAQRKPMERYRSQAKPSTRGDWQRSIEDNIAMFNPDVIEAQELLAALTAGLKNRYDEGQLSDVDHEVKQLQEALVELEKTTCAPGLEDEAYADWLARHDEP